MADEHDAIDDFLTDEERAALEDDSDEIEEQDGGDAEEAQADDSDDTEADQGGEVDERAAAGDDDAEQVDDKADQVDSPAPQVDLAALDEQIATLKSDRKALIEQYDDGDLTNDELEEKLGELDEQSSDLIGQRAVAQHAAQQEEAQWMGAVKGYLGQHPGLKDSDDVLVAFDKAVRSVTGNSLYASLSYEQQLSAAHELLELQARHAGLKGVPPAKAEKQAEEPKPAHKAKQQEAQPDRPDMRTPPKTLAHASASDISGKNDSPMAALQSLIDSGDSDAIEAAMMKMTEEQRDEFSSMLIG